MTIRQDARTWQQQYSQKYGTGNNNDNFIAIINTVDYTKNAVVIVRQQC